jgi:Bifunctional DNA primase/polymerase, N-terminal
VDDQKNVPGPAAKGPAEAQPDYHDLCRQAGAECKAEALKLCELGLAPIPLCDPNHYATAKNYSSHTKNCKEKSWGKAPIVPWKDYQDKLPTKEEITRWWDDYPIANVGLVTGQGSGIARIDVDGEWGRQELLGWSRGDLPKTWMFKSSETGQTQYLYAWPATLPCKSTASRGEGEHEELRLQGDGQQTVIPPSRHKSGSRYGWIPGHGPDDIPLAMAPQWLQERMGAKPKAKSKAPVARSGQSLELGDLGVGGDIKTLIREGVPTGQRSEALRRVERALVKGSYGGSEILEILTNPGYGISEKPLEQGEDWTYGDIARAQEAASKSAMFEDVNLFAEEEGQAHSLFDVGTESKPRIIVRYSIRAYVDSGIQALLKKDLNLYQRDGMLVSIQEIKRKEKTEHTKNPLVPRIVVANTSHMLELAGEAADWFKPDSRIKKGFKQTRPPLSFVQHVQGRPGWDFRVLAGLTTVPTLRSDGSVIESPGYDERTGLYYHPNRAYPEVPDAPTWDDARAAYTNLCEPFKDFPFVDDCHGSVALAAVLSIVVRHLLRTVPMFPVRSNVAGSGKGLLVDTIARIATGQGAAVWDEVRDPEEERKRLLVIAMNGDRVTCIDNLTQPLGSGPLDRAITEPNAKGRLLGFSKDVEAELTTVFFASGNNMTWLFRI